MTARGWIRRALFGAAGLLVGAALALPVELQRLPYEPPADAPRPSASTSLPQAVVDAGAEGWFSIPTLGVGVELGVMEVPASGVIDPPDARAFSLNGMPAEWPVRVIVLHSSRSHDPAAAIGNRLLDARGAPLLAIGDVVLIDLEKLVVSEVIVVLKSETASVLTARPGAAAAIVTCTQDDADTRPAGAPAARNAIFFLEAATSP